MRVTVCCHVHSNQTLFVAIADTLMCNVMFGPGLVWSSFASTKSLFARLQLLVLHVRSCQSILIYLKEARAAPHA